MRRLVIASIAVAVGLPLAGCSGDPVVMPDVVGKRLDVATSDVERAGFKEDVEVLGGGAFGVIDESNWTVCSQDPADGVEISDPPRFTVDRSCDEVDTPESDEETSDPTDASSAEATPDDEVAATLKKRPNKKRAAGKRKPGAPVSETFVMPALVGMNLQVAQDLLQDRGSFLLTQTDGTGQERFQVLDSGWKVCAQAPAPGVTTDIATLVELVAVKLSERC